MMDSVAALVPTYGPLFLGFLVALSCLGIPIPASLALITAGGLVASNDMELPAVLIYSFGGAIIGDHIGYFAGLKGSDRFARFMNGNPERIAAHESATAGLRRWGGVMVFFTRWMITPPGPIINFLAGISKLNILAFSMSVLAGEMVWVLVYVFAGYMLSTRVASFLPVVTDASWLVVVFGILLVLVIQLWRKMCQAPEKSA